MLCSLLRNPRLLGSLPVRAARNLRTATVLREEEAGAPSEDVMDAVEIDAKATEYYKSHSGSHFNLPLDQIEFRIGEHFVTKKPHPFVHFVGPTDVEQPYNGITNVTPFSKTLFPWFGMTGNIGKSSKYAKGSDGVIKDPKDAKQEIPVVTEPTNPEVGDNEQLKDYMQWLEGLNDKYIDHLTENLEAYPILEKKFGFLLKSDPERTTVRQMVESMVQQPVKNKRDEDGSAIPGSEYLIFDQKLYYSNSQGSKAFVRCELDEEMNEQGFVRKHIPLYDRHGKEISLDQAKLQSGDVVSVQSNITCRLYDVGGNVGAGLGKNIKSVTLLRARPSSESVEQAPPFQF